MGTCADDPYRINSRRSAYKWMVSDPKTWQFLRGKVWFIFTPVCVFPDMRKCMNALRSASPFPILYRWDYSFRDNSVTGIRPEIFETCWNIELDQADRTQLIDPSFLNRSQELLDQWPQRPRLARLGEANCFQYQVHLPDHLAWGEVDSSKRMDLTIFCLER